MSKIWVWPDANAELPQLNSVLRHFGHQAVSVHRCSGGFSRAMVYRVQTSSGLCMALRRTPEDAALPVDRLRLLHRLLRFASDSGVSALAVPLVRLAARSIAAASDSGPSFVVDPRPRQGREAETVLRTNDSALWQVEPWKPGRPLTADELTPPHLTSALQTLHGFHSAAAGFAARMESNPWFQVRAGRSPAVARRLEIVEQLLDGQLGRLQRSAGGDADPEFRQLASEFCDVLSRRLPRLFELLKASAAGVFPLQPVIRDLWSEHLLFSETQLTGLIDLTACATDHVTVDLSRLLRSWFGSRTDSLQGPVHMFEQARGSALDDRECRLLEVLDACTVLLSPVTWLQRRYELVSSTTAADAAVRERFRMLVKQAIAFQPLHISRWPR